MPSTPLVSFVISTFNRCDVLLQTLGQIERCGLASSDFEILVIDNASRDGTADAVAERFPRVRLFPQSVNSGSCAKNIGIENARGLYVVFLDDDSYPHTGSIARMIEYFVQDPTLGAAGFNVHLTNGKRECSAYSDVFIGCGVGFRKLALDQVGSLPTDFFMQAEEYDLSLRLLDAGWKIATFDDLHVTHLKTPAARWPTRVARLDARNNLSLIARRFPARWKLPFAIDWMKRYWMIASANDRRAAFLIGVAQGLARLVHWNECKAISNSAFEQFARIDEIRSELVRAQKELNLKKVLFADLGKNILPYYLAVRELGLEVIAIADDKLGGRRYRYRGIPIFTEARAATFSFDAVVVSNSSPVHGQATASRWRAKTAKAVLNLCNKRELVSAGSRGFGSGRASFDRTESRPLSKAA